jgi:hypothetical protein
MKHVFTVIMVMAGLTAIGQTKTPFIEVLTSATCGPCRPGNENLKAVLDNYPGQYVQIKYQMSWPGSGDDYYTQEAGSRRGYYGTSGIPDMFVNGANNYDPRNFTAADFESYLTEPASMEIAVWDSLDPANQTVYYDVQMIPTDTISAVAYRAFVAIVERTTFLNVATNGETEFYDVMKKLIPGGSGEFILDQNGLTPDTAITFQGSYTFNGSYDATTTADNPVNHASAHTVESFDSLYVIAWLQDMQTKEVIQASSSLLAAPDDSTGTSIGEGLAEQSGFEIYPNPASEVMQIEFNRDYLGSDIEFYDVQGRRVLSDRVENTSVQTLNISGLTQGIYILKIGEDTKRISVK